MAASAGTVTLNLDANSVKLLRELQKAERSTKKSTMTMGADFKRMAANTAKSLAVIGTAFAAMTTKLTRDGLRVIDANAKMARSLGASNDALQALRMAAGDSGLQGLEASLNRMNRRLGAAEFGAGAAAVTVKALNLNLAELSKMDVDERLQSIANTMRDAGISTEQQARHLQNLGFEQATANEFFRNGITDLSTYKKEIDALGLSLSDIDVSRVERANDAMGIFGDVIQGISQRVAVNMSDILFHFSEAFNTMAVESGGLGTIVDEMFDKILMGSIDVFESIGTALSPIISITKSLWESFMSLPQFARELGIVGALLFGRIGLAAVIAMTTAIKGLQGAVGIIAEQLPESEFREGSQLDRLQKLLSNETEFSPINEMAGLFNPQFENNVSEQASRLRSIFDKVIEDRKSFQQEYTKITRAEPTGIIFSDDTPGQFDGIEEYMAELEASAMRMFESTRSATETAVRELHEFWLIVQQVGEDRLEALGVNVNQVFDSLLDNIENTLPKIEAKDELTAMSEFAKQAARSIQSSFSDFFFDPFKDGLKGMAESFVNVIRRMIAETLALKAIMALAGIGGPIGAFFQMALPTMDKGGRGVAGQPYMIGRGAQPEMFIPDSAGTFIPNADKMGGQSLTINVDARDEGAEARIRDMINREMAPQIIAAAKGSTVAALRRPRFA